MIVAPDSNFRTVHDGVLVRNCGGIEISAHWPARAAIYPTRYHPDPGRSSSPEPTSVATCGLRFGAQSGSPFPDSPSRRVRSRGCGVDSLNRAFL